MTRRPSGLCVGVALALLVGVSSCSQNSDPLPSATETTSTSSDHDFSDIGQTSQASPWIWIRRTADVAPLFLYTQGRTGLTAEGEVSVGGIGNEIGQRDCTHWVMLFLEGAAEGYREVLRVHPNFCGAIAGNPFIEVGVDRVVTGQKHHEDDFAEVEGSVVVNGAGQHGVAPDQSVPIVIDETFRDEVLDHVCVDVTVRSGAAGPDGTVGARIELLAGDTLVETRYPGRADQTPDRPPRVDQKPNQAVMYPSGSVRTADWALDTVRVETVAGTIESWEVTARAC